MQQHYITCSTVQEGELLISKLVTSKSYCLVHYFSTKLNVKCSVPNFPIILKLTVYSEHSESTSQISYLQVI